MSIERVEFEVYHTRQIKFAKYRNEINMVKMDHCTTKDSYMSAEGWCGLCMTFYYVPANFPSSGFPNRIFVEDRRKHNVYNVYAASL